jgi:glutathione synthase/RimK-type ligase-like ATP-grasp enzyme
MDNLDDFVCYDELLYAPLQKRGWETAPVSWRHTDIDWNTFEAVVIRSTWDYQNDPLKFISVLETIDRSAARLENNIKLVKWNINKTYLKDLEQRGVAIVPTLWISHIRADRAKQYFDTLNAQEIIIKPVISANADDTFRLSNITIEEIMPDLISLFQERDCMVQPFMEGIIQEGEFSVFFFGDQYSHTILKTPKAEDFRVQEEHGGTLRLIQPETALLIHAQKAFEAIWPRPLYARIDFVRVAGGFLVMEMELIEPSLYFNMDPSSPERFADVFDNWMSACH